MRAAPRRVWDLLVIGGGSAGLVAARTAASFGATVALVERDRTGGDCLWTGCVPSKALLAAAAAAADARAATRLGVHTDAVRVDFAAVMAHVRRAMATIAPVDAPAALAGAGVHLIHGPARFVGPDRALVDGRPVRFRHAVIATGSVPALPSVQGLAGDGVVTTDDVWDLVRLPARLTVLGGGSIGCELGQAFARLGSRVTIVEAAPRLLVAEDPAASGVLTAALCGEGIEVICATAATALVRHPDGLDLVLDDGRRIEADVVLVATGRRPDTAALDPVAAGVRTDPTGAVVVDRQLRTTNPRIWAAGDVTGHPRFTHVAGVHGSTAATNAVLGLRRRADLVIPRVTFTSPEVAAVGAPTGHTVRTVENTELDRAVAEGSTTGFTRVVLDRRGTVVGATVVGPRAGEALAELTLAVRHRLRARDVAATMHPYPTWADGPWNTTIADVRARLAARPAAFALRLWVRARRHLAVLPR